MKLIASCWNQKKKHYTNVYENENFIMLEQKNDQDDVLVKMELEKTDMKFIFNFLESYRYSRWWYK